MIPERFLLALEKIADAFQRLAALIEKAEEREWKDE